MQRVPGKSSQKQLESWISKWSSNAARPCFGEFPQCRCIEDDDRAVLQPDPVARRPRPQLLIDAPARHADHLADFLLCDENGMAFGAGLVLFDQAQQSARKSPRQILQNDVLDLISGPT